MSDLEKKGGWNYFYRLKAGSLPYVAEVLPLGVGEGRTGEVAVKGANLGDVRTVEVEPARNDELRPALSLRVRTGHGEAVNKVRLAVGNTPETLENEPN